MIVIMMFSTWCLTHAPWISSTTLVRCELRRDVQDLRTRRHERRRR